MELVALDYIYHDGKDFKPGDEIKFSEGQESIAESLLAQGKVGKKGVQEADPANPDDSNPEFTPE